MKAMATRIGDIKSIQELNINSKVIRYQQAFLLYDIHIKVTIANSGIDKIHIDGYLTRRIVYNIWRNFWLTLVA